MEDSLQKGCSGLTETTMVKLVKRSFQSFCANAFSHD